MNKRLLAICYCFLALFAHTSAAQTFSVSDPKLQQCLQSIAKKEQWRQPADFIDIKCHGNNIRSLQGLEAFTNVVMLSIYNNKLSRIDVDLTRLKQLKTLNLARNNIEQAELAKLESLEKVYLFSNGLRSLKLGGLTKLKEIKANNNKISDFHYVDLPRLEKMYIFNNELETINIYDLPSLQYMDCRENPMPDELYDEMDQLEHITFLHDGNAEDW